MNGPGVPTRHHRDPGIRLPAGFGAGATETLLAIVAITGRGVGCSVRDIATHLGGRSTSTVHSHLRHLQRVGLVTYTPGRAATIRPTVAVVAHTPAHREQEARDLVLAADRQRRLDRGR